MSRIASTVFLCCRIRHRRYGLGLGAVSQLELTSASAAVAYALSLSSSIIRSRICAASAIDWASFALV